VAGREVDDLEPAHRQGRRAFEEEAFVVGASVGETVIHPLEDGSIGRPVPAREDVTDDPAHVV